MALFALFAPLVKREGLWRLVLSFIVLEALSLLLLGFVPYAGAAVIALLGFLIFSPALYLTLDVFLEKSVSDESGTGGIRGMFLTMQNVSQIIAPFLAGLMLTASVYWHVYAASAAFLAGAFIVAAIFLKRFDKGGYHTRSLLESGRYVLRHRILYDVVVSQFLLRVFYAWMTIYMPLYLVRYIGFSWSAIGVMFAIMLSPFLILELPLGRMIDKNIVRDHDVLVAGFTLMAVTMAVVPFLATPVFWVWTTVLFISRIGASCTEIATESYFFRHVDGSYADTISFFRFLRPTGYVAAAGLAALSLSVMPLSYSFFVLAACMAYGLRYARKLRGK